MLFNLNILRYIIIDKCDLSNRITTIINLVATVCIAHLLKLKKISAWKRNLHKARLTILFVAPPATYAKTGWVGR